MKFKSDIEVQAGLKDSSGSNGSSGQVLSSNGTTVSWVNAGGGVASDVQNLVKAGVAINKGQAVYVTSADGTNIIVGLASNTTEATSSKTLGLLDATVAINGMANVVQIGRLEGLNTLAATVGDPVWLGANGNLIYGLINKPYAPLHLVFIGVVTRVNANNGEIFVNVQNGFELNEIHDVDLKTNVPINGDILGYNGTLWVNKTIAGWLGYTPANQAITIATTAPLSGGGDLSANRTLSISQAGAASNGYLSANDWGIFNGKQNALNGTGFVKISGTTISYDNSTYTPTSRTITINGVTQDLSANQTWTIASGVTSFNTRTGAITLTSGDVTTALGYTPVTDARTITINGVAQDLSANRSWTVTAVETDTLQTVTSRGSSTSTSITAKSGSTSASLNAFAFMGAGEFMTTGGNAGYFFERREGSVTSTTNWAGWYYSGSSIRLYNGSSDILSIAASNGAITNSPGGTSGGYYLSDSSAGLYRDNSYDVVLLQNNASGNVLYMAGAGDVRVSIDSNDNDTGSRFIVGNNAVKASNELFSVNESGTAFASNDFRSPLFYDSNDTTYYLNPHLTSRIESVWVRGASATDGKIAVGGSSYNAAMNINYDQIWTASGNLHLQYSSGGNIDMNAGGGYTFSRTSLRAPIFYDYNDTGYYADFASASSEAIRVRGGAYHGPNPTWGAYLLVGGDGRNGYMNNTLVASVCATDGNLHMDAASGKNMYLNYYDGATIYLGNGAESIIGTMDTSGNFSVSSSHRSPIFYDSNNTAYYLDPSSTGYSSFNAGGARFRNIEISNSTYTDTIQNVNSGGNIWINYGHNGPVGLGYGGGLTTAYTSLAVNGTSTTTRLSNTFTISPHSGGVDLHSTGNFAPHYQSDFSWYVGAIGAGVNRATLNSFGDFTANASSRSPIFYDSNNTTYYVDPASTSNLVGLTVANTISGNISGTAAGNIAKSSIGTVVGTYYNTSAGNIGGVKVRLPVNVNASQMVSFTLRVYQDYQSYDVQFSGYLYSTANQWYEARAIGIGCSSSANVRMGRDDDGRAYVWIQGGSYTGAAVFNLVNGYATADWNSGWEIVRTNYTPSLALDTTVYPNINTGNYSGYSNFGGNAVYGGIFYDGNDYGYYVDPNASSVLYNLTLIGGKHTYLYINPGNGYEAMVRYSGGSGSSWYVGKRVSAQTVGTADFHLYSEAAGNTVFGVTASGAAIAVSNMQSPVFYDYNDTSFYLDANSTGTSLRVAGELNIQGVIRMRAGGETSTYISEGWGIRLNGVSTQPVQVPNASLGVGFGAGGGDYGVGNGYFTGDVTAYYSDRRLKHNLVLIDNAIEKVKSLNGYTYQHNELGQELLNENAHKLHAGLIAQEVQAVLPEVVTIAPFDLDGYDEQGKGISKSGENYLTIKYERIVPLLIEAIKEQQTQIEELKELVNKLINKQ